MTIHRTPNRGFTLSELMIVVTIVGIMSAIAIPAYTKFQCHTKQSEARQILKGMWVVEEVYSSEFGGYITIADMTAYGGLGAASLATRYYGFTMGAGSNASWYELDAQDGAPRQSVQVGSPIVDRWIISSDDARPTAISDACN